MCRVWVGVDKEDLDGTGYPAGKVGYGLQCKSKKKVGNFFVDVVPKNLILRNGLEQWMNQSKRTKSHQVEQDS